MNDIVVRDRRRHVIRAIDQEYGTEVQVQFDAESGLLVGETDVQGHRAFGEYRRVKGLLLPFEGDRGDGAFMSERWQTSVNDGLTAGYFAVPAERQWAGEDQRRIVLAHVRPMREDLRLRRQPFYQGPQPEPPVVPTAIDASPLEIDLLDRYLERKLATAGLAATDSPWRLQAYIGRYYQTVSLPRWRQVEIAVRIVQLDDVAWWQGRIVRRWPLSEHAEIDDVLGDGLTALVLDQVATGLRAVQDAAREAGRHGVPAPPSPPEQVPSPVPAVVSQSAQP